MWRAHAEAPRRAPAPGGFTLVEVMVALVVAAVVALAAHAALSLATEALARRRAAAEPVLHGYAVRRALDAWLRAAWLGAGPFLATDRRGSAGEQDELAFGVADGGALHPGPARIRLWIERDPRAPRQGALAEVTTPAAPGTRTDTLVLDAGATGLALRYRVWLQGRPRWVDAWESERQLPDALVLRLTGTAAPGGAAAVGGAAAESGEAGALLRLAVSAPVGWSAP